MGKVVGLVGAASGKIGNIVYAVTNGIQTARVYQSVVSNPKSTLQNIQRAKGNLAGRISSFTPRTAIMGMGSNNRTRRGEFLRNILKKATVTQSSDVFKAKIAENDVIFSKGAVPLSVYNPVINASSNSLSVVLSASALVDEDTYAAAQTRIVVMVYDLTTQELIDVITKMASKPNYGAALSTSILIPHHTGYIADVYLIPMSTADGSSVSIDTSIAGKSDDDIVAVLSANGNAVVFNYGKSLYAGSDTYTPV